jgi:hypothetical protein
VQFVGLTTSTRIVHDGYCYRVYDATPVLPKHKQDMLQKERPLEDE